MLVVMQRGGRGIRYADERFFFDRDERGVLWSREPSQPGRGEPLFGKVHSLRQRLAMSQLRCQICGGPADQSADGVLWIIDSPSEDISPGEKTAHPPVCRPCAHRSVIACPHLRGRFTAVRVRCFAPVGVNGALYGLSPEGRVEEVDAMALTFTDPRLPYLRAHQLIMRLTDFSLIDLNDPTA